MEPEPIYTTYMNTKEAASLLGYTMQHTRLLVREGVLPGLKFGRDWLVERVAVARYLGEYRDGTMSEKSRDENTDVLPQAVNVAQVPQRSPFRYPGGKTWLVPYIRQWLGSHSHRITELIEPFAGGGIVSLTAVFEQLATHATMVELDEDVGAVWTAVLNGKGEWLAQQIERFTPATDMLHDLFMQDNRSIEYRAFLTIVRNRVARGGIMAPGAGIVKNGENGKGLTSRWYPETLSRRIRDIIAEKGRFTFIQGDGLQLMHDQADREDCVWFIDPPYTVAGKRLYRHSDIDHDLLFSHASRLAGDVLMTYDNADEIRFLADKYHLEHQRIAMKTTHHLAKYELLIGRSLNWLVGG